LLYESGQWEKAREAFDRVVKLKPEYYEAWLQLGNSLDKLERYEEAISSYDRALQLKPNNDDVWCNRGVALYKLGRY
jgi:tetratricopeptide (TPR) repeat protein